MAKTNRRQHFIARFYLRNFAEPLFSDDLCVYDMDDRKRRWERRTPDGIGWFPHLCSMIDLEGNRTDAFDQFLKLHVEDPAIPALKKLATGGAIDPNDRSAVALFVALTAARSPELMSNTTTEYLEGLTVEGRAELDALVKQWCDWTRKPFSQNSYSEFLKPGSFGAIWIWSLSLQQRLLQWEWHLIHTTRNQPFVTSDQPVYAERDQDLQLVSCPISSEVALLVCSGGQFRMPCDGTSAAYAMNRQTMHRASKFVVACRETFPGDEFLLPASRPHG